VTIDERLRADLALPDPATPNVDDALRAVRSGATKRRRTRRAAGITAVVVVAAVAVVAVLQFRGDGGTQIQSVPTSDSGSAVLVPAKLPYHMTLVAASTEEGRQGPSADFGSSVSGTPFAFTRTYALYSPDGSRVERSFRLEVGRGDANTDAYRNGWEAAQVGGFPAKISSALAWTMQYYTTLVWLDDSGRIFQLIGDISPAEAFDVANGLVIDPNGGLEPKTVKPGTLPPGFVHLIDFTLPRHNTFTRRYELYYATPSRDATLQIDLQQQSTETVDERLLVRNSRVVAVRGHRGVFVEPSPLGRELRWLEPPHTLVTMTATTLTEDQLREIARSLRPISDTEWRRLRRDAGPLGAPRTAGTIPPATVAALPAIGPEVVAASGTIDGNKWKLVVYEVAPAIRQTERRFCYELRGAQAARQSCFPLRPEGAGVKWTYAERHLGRWFLLGAAAHDAPTELGDNQGQPVPLQIFDDPALPMQVFVAALPDPYDGSVDVRNQSYQRVQLAGPVPDGSRQPFSTPGLPGVYPEFATGLFAPPPGRPQPPIVKPEPSPFCAAIEDFRTAGLTDELAKLPYFERMRAVAPTDSQPPLDTIIEWLRQGAPQPKPAEVGSAEFQTTRDWIRHCQS
jgi:hypothetical protein